MIRVSDSSGSQWLINLQFVEVVEFPSTDPALANNRNSEKVVMRGGLVLNLNPGEWEAALSALYDEFDASPQPKENVKGQLYIVPPLP